MNSIPYPFTLFDSLDEGVYIVDKSWRYIYVNSKAAAIQAKPREELLGKNIWEVYPEAVESVSFTYAQRAVAENTTITFEAYYPLVETWFECRCYPIPEGLIILLQDINKRKCQEEALRQSQARARRLIDANIIGIVISDMDHIFEANDAFLEIVGYTREDLAARRINWIDMTPPEFLPLDMNAIQELKELGTFTSFEKAYYRKDGRIVPILIGGAVLEQDPLQWVCFILDISNQKQLEQALRQSEERMRLAIKAGAISVYQQDRDLRYTWLYSPLQPYAVQGMVGKTDADLLEVDEASHVMALKRRVMETGESHQEVVKGTREVGTDYFDLSIEPLRDANGNIIGVTGTSRNATEQVELEQRKDNFISMASHELRTPITVLRGFTQLLTRQLDQQGMHEPVSLLKTMDLQIAKLVKLIDELLDASKIQAGRLDYEEKPVDLDALVHETVELLRANTPSHTLHVTGATHATIQGDKDRLGQVLINLITNAVKYSPEANRVDIALSSSQNTASISIRDYGVGIAPTHQKHIFDRFYRVHDSSNKSFKGLGLGLYIAHDIVQRHGGNLTIESEEGKGSTFTISLPLEKQVSS
jgi:PAS domain S-box-containing protein